MSRFPWDSSDSKWSRPAWRFSSAEPRASVSVLVPTELIRKVRQHPVDLLMGLATSEGYTPLRSKEEDLPSGLTRYTLECELATEARAAGGAR